MTSPFAHPCAFALPPDRGDGRRADRARFRAGNVPRSGSEAGDGCFFADTAGRRRVNLPSGSGRRGLREARPRSRRIACLQHKLADDLGWSCSRSGGALDF